MQGEQGKSKLNRAKASRTRGIQVGQSEDKENKAKIRRESGRQGE